MAAINLFRLSRRLYAPCKRDNLKTLCLITFKFSYDLNTIKTLDAIEFGHSMKNKMAAIALFHVKSAIACKRDNLKMVCLITFKFSYDLNTIKTLDAIDFGHSMKNKMAAIALFHVNSTIACKRDNLKTLCLITFKFSYDLNTIKTLDAIDFGHSTKNKMAAITLFHVKAIFTL